MENKTNKPKRVRKRQNGRLQVQKRPDAAKNARTPRITLVHGGAAKVAAGRVIDRRTRLGKEDELHQTELTAHVGGEPTVAQRELIVQASWFRILRGIAFAELMEAVEAGQPISQHPALDAIYKAAHQQREALKLLGLDRKAKDISLKDVLNQKPEGSDE